MFILCRHHSEESQALFLHSSTRFQSFYTYVCVLSAKRGARFLSVTLREELTGRLHHSKREKKNSSGRDVKTKENPRPCGSRAFGLTPRGASWFSFLLIGFCWLPIFGQTVKPFLPLFHALLPYRTTSLSYFRGYHRCGGSKKKIGKKEKTGVSSSDRFFRTLLYNQVWRKEGEKNGWEARVSQVGTKKVEEEEKNGHIRHWIDSEERDGKSPLLRCCRPAKYKASKHCLVGVLEASRMLFVSVHVLYIRVCVLLLVRDSDSAG